MMLLTILSLAACGSSTDSAEPDIIGMPNPFTDFDTLAEAEKQTGFDITLPDAIGSYSYSLSLSDGLSLSDWQTLIDSIQS